MAQVAVTKVLKNLPKQFNAADVAKLDKRRAVTFKSDVITFADTTAINLFELPGNVLVQEVDVRVTTAFDGTGTSASATATITIPNDTGTEVLWDAGASQLTATGFKPSTAMGVTPASGGMLIMNYTPNTTTAGQMEVYVTYVQYESEL